MENGIFQFPIITFYNNENKQKFNEFNLEYSEVLGIQLMEKLKKQNLVELLEKCILSAAQGGNKCGFMEYSTGISLMV